MNYMSLGMSNGVFSKSDSLLLTEKNDIFSEKRKSLGNPCENSQCINLCKILKRDSTITINTLPKTETTVNHFLRFKTDSYRGWVKTFSHAETAIVSGNI